MTEKELAITKIVHDIGNQLCDGNEKSHNLGLLLLHTSVLPLTDEKVFNEMASKIGTEIYEKDLRGWWNDLYVKNGGELGSGIYSTIESGKFGEISGFDPDKCLDGLDPVGFNKLQALLPFMSDIGKIPPVSETFNSLEKTIWAIFISVFREDAIEKLMAIMSLPEYTPKIEK